MDHNTMPRNTGTMPQSHTPTIGITYGGVTPIVGQLSPLLGEVGGPLVLPGASAKPGLFPTQPFWDE